MSLIVRTPKTVQRILTGRIDRKIEDVLGEDQFGFRRGTRKSDAIWMLKITPE